jgi:hypothetical protein
LVDSTSELYDKSEPEPRQLPVVEIISALNYKYKSETGPLQLLFALNYKSEPEPRQLPVEEGIAALNDKSESGPRQRRLSFRG